MAGKTFSGIYPNGIALSIASYNPVSVTGTAAVGAYTALYGRKNTIWTVTNSGTITSGGAKNSYGIVLANGGTITNAGGSIGANGWGIASFDAGTSSTIPSVGLWLTNQTGGRIGGSTYGGVYAALSTYVLNQPNATIQGGTQGIFVYRGVGTVVNQGTIQGVFGLRLIAGATITNNLGGVIYGSRSGIQTYGTANAVVTNTSGGTIGGKYFGIHASTGRGTVVNAGTISDSATYAGAGVQLAAGGTVTNNAGGFINSKWIGVQIGYFSTTSTTSSGTVVQVNQSINGAVSNQGTIIANFPVPNHPGIYDGAAVWTHGQSSIYNGSSGTITGGGFGVVGYYQTTLTNRGSIGGSAYAVLIKANGTLGSTITNTGSILGGSKAGAWLTAGGTVSNGSGARISGGAYGIYFTGAAPSTLTNSGSISGTLAASAMLKSGGYVSNAATGTITGAGVAVSGAAGTVVNQGLIASTSGTREGVDLLLGGSVSNGATGVISANAGAAVYVKGGTVTNAGTLTGIGAAAAVSFAGGFTNRLIADPGAVFNGLANGGNTAAASVSTLELAAGAAGGTLSGLGTQFINFSQITIDATANWTFAGANTLAAGGTFGDAGTLSLNNGATFASGGTLDGVSGSGGLTAGVAVTGAGSAWRSSGQQLIGGTGMGGLSILLGGGATAGAGAIIAGSAAASGSSVNVVGAGSAWHVTGVLNVGAAGAGALVVNAGGSVTASSVDVGVSAAGIGQIAVTGTGSALTLTGNLAIADSGTGALSILGGAVVSAANINIGGVKGSSGSVFISGAGSTLTATGALTIGSPNGGVGDLTVGPGAFIKASSITYYGSAVLEGGTIDPTVQTLTGSNKLGGTGQVGNRNDPTAVIIDESKVGIAVDPNGTLLVIGTIVGGGGWSENGTVQSTNFAASKNFGLLDIGDGGTMELTGPVLSGGTFTTTDLLTPTNTYTITGGAIDVTLDGPGSVLKLDNIAGFGGTITSIQPGGSFVITTPGTTDALANLNIVNGRTLTFTDNGTAEKILFGAGFALDPSGFSIVNGNTIVACFLAGTRIATPDGRRTVETLLAGDEVATQLGGPGRIKWVGSRTIDCSKHPRPEQVWPIRIAAHAVARNVPERDLYVSPDHALYLDGVLIPAKHLVNGTTITQVKRRRVVYHHIELERHDVVLAEGLPAETYLDTGDRAKFSGGRVTNLFPDFAAKLWTTRGCGELVQAGPELRKIRARIAARAPDQAVRPARGPV